MSDVLLAEALTERLVGLAEALDATLHHDILARVAARVVVLTDGQVEPDAALLSGLSRAATEAVNAIGELEQATRSTLAAYQSARSDSERREIIQSRLLGMVTDPRRLAGDLAATRRWLDVEALIERFESQVSEHVDQAIMAHRSARALLGTLCKDAVLPVDVDGELLLKTAFSHAASAHHEMLAVESIRLAQTVVDAAPDTERGLMLGARRWAEALEWARSDRRGAFVQMASLDLCLATHPEATLELVEERLRARDQTDGMLVRYRALEALGRVGCPPREQLAVARVALDDPSEHVRQGLARCLARLDSPAALTLLAGPLCRKDASPRVRGVALRELVRQSSTRAEAVAPATEATLIVLDAAVAPPAEERSSSDLLANVALELLEIFACGPLAPLRAPVFVPVLERLVQSSDASWPVAERSARLLARFEVFETGRLDQLRQTFDRYLGPLVEGQRTRVELVPETPRESLEKALAVSVGTDLPVELIARRPGLWQATRGERRRFRFWRLLHELEDILPDKRQGYPHVAGRMTAADTVVAPVGMAEVTPTRVPGERRVNARLGGWGAFLPRVDDLLAASSLTRPWRRIVTSFGTVVVEGPAGWHVRVWGRIRLTLRYARFADQRERALAARDRTGQAGFARLARTLGFRFRLEGSSGAVCDQAYDRRSPRVIAYLDPGDS